MQKLDDFIYFERGLMMEKIKKLLCAVLICVVCSAVCCEEAGALFGNTHFNLGKKMLEQSDKMLSESVKNAFLSGLVYADIGRFKFDKETGIDSDSDKFVQEMKKFAKTPEEKWFVRGFEVHVLQDNKTGRFLIEILGRKSPSYFEYIMDCSILDSYFMNKNGGLYNEFLNRFNFEQVSSDVHMTNLSKVVNISEDKIKDFVMLELSKYSACPNKHSLVIYDDLIQKTYRSFGFEISIDEINEQAANIVGAFVVTSTVARKKEFPESLASKIEAKSYEFAKFCMTKFNAE